MRYSKEKNVLETLEFNKVLIGIKDEATSYMGKKLSSNLRPTNIFDVAKEWLEETKEAVAVLQTASPPFGGICYISPFLKRTAIGAMLEAENFKDILSTLYAIKSIKKFFAFFEGDVPILKEWASKLTILSELERKIEETFDEGGNVRDNASKDLAIIRRSIKSSQASIKKKLESVLQSTENKKYFQDAIVTMRGDRYVIPIKLEYRNYFPGIVHDQSSTGATLFIEPIAVVELNNELKEQSIAEKREIERIFRNLSEAVNLSQKFLEENIDILSQFDFTFAKAKFAIKHKAVYPNINTQNNTALIQARHPLINPDKVVPIDLKLGEKYSALVVTGANTGGKTVTMKTLGLLSLMAKSGLFITADENSKIAFYENIYADIGDEQGIEQSLSTFSGHMTHIISLLKKVKSNDLLLLDELGAGTDPAEGSSLAVAILEKLLQNDVNTVITTHYPELKTFAYQNENAENACVEFDINTLQPTYRLLIGVPGASNAFQISEKLGLPLEIIENARKHLNNDQISFTKIVNELEREKIIYEEKNAALEIRQRSVAQLEKRLKDAEKKLTTQKSNILQKAHDESLSIIQHAKQEAEAVIKDLKVQFDDFGVQRRKAAMQEARRRLQAAADEAKISDFNDDKFNIPVDLKNISSGDIVFISTLKQKGTVLEIQGKNLLLQVGNLKTSVAAKKCSFVSKKKKETTVETFAYSGNISLKKTYTAIREIDIRGMTIDEGEQCLSKFIDDAMLAGLKQLLIIHGKGTGALRKGIHEYLKNHKNVASFWFADIADGGTGSTNVNLK